MTSNLKPQHYAEIAREDYTTVGVQITSKELTPYTYKVTRKDLESWGLKAGSVVVIPVGERSNEDGKESFFPNFRVGVIAEIHSEPRIDFDSVIVYRWIVGPVGTENYDENRRKDEAIIKAIRDKQQRIQREAIRNALLGTDPELMALTGASDLVAPKPPEAPENTWVVGGDHGPGMKPVAQAIAPEVARYVTRHITPGSES